jgi:leucyl aminopeptidase
LVSWAVVHVEATTTPPLAAEADTIAVGLFDDAPVTSRVPEAVFGALIRSGEASPALGRLAEVRAGERRLILAGLGPREGFGPEQARAVAAAVEGRTAELSASSLCWEAPDVGPEFVAGLIEGTLLHAYRFDRYQPAPADRQLERLLISSPQDLSELARRVAVVTGAQNRARDLGNTPGNDLTPSALADYARNLAGQHGQVQATVLGGEEIRRAGMGAFAAVAQGSAEDPRLIRLDYEPDSPRGPHLGLVGKGVTFDAGGLWLKPHEALVEMKFDMCGAAAVIEAVGALAELQVPVRVTAVVGATENLLGGRAVKPGDIVRAMDGTTIEVNNTDAEGRLVLADCLCYARQQGCERLVDIATLTGGVVIALGTAFAGLMSNEEDWGERVRAAGARVGERLWQLPLDEEYAAMVRGRYAQLTNFTERAEAKAITAAELLHHFAGDTPWAHLDIAGTAYDVPRPYFVGKGATGFGVRLLVELARSAAD